VETNARDGVSVGAILFIGESVPVLAGVAVGIGTGVEQAAHKNARAIGSANFKRNIDSSSA
jgi:hypothetical protein